MSTHCLSHALTSIPSHSREGKFDKSHDVDRQHNGAWSSLGGDIVLALIIWDFGGILCHFRVILDDIDSDVDSFIQRSYSEIRNMIVICVNDLLYYIFNLLLIKQQT